MTRRLPTLVAAAALAGAVAVITPAAAAAAEPNGSAEVGTAGLRFTGLDGVNQVAVGITGNRFLIKDIAPITAGAGCVDATVEVGKFGVFCQIPLNPNGTRKQFTVNLGGGDDTVTNTTDVSMRADGSSGNDTLLGGPASDDLRDAFGGDVLRGGDGRDILQSALSQNDGLVDILDGGPGDDDLSGGDSRDIMTGGTGQDFLDGGLGPDDMDPGADNGDIVTYLDNVHNGLVVVTLDDIANDGNYANGVSEGDRVAAHTPILIGSPGQDIFIGNNSDNDLRGLLGDDRLFGLGGNDSLVCDLGTDFADGGTGADTQSSCESTVGIP